MVAELGETGDPRALVPGDPAAVAKTQTKMTSYGDILAETGDGLQRIDGTNGWSGAASDQFRAAYSGHTAKWLAAGSAFHAAAGALSSYVSTLTWAQRQAVEAIDMWNEGQAATATAQAEHDRAEAKAWSQAAAKPSIGGPVLSPVIPFTDPGEAKREAARQQLTAARAQLADAGDTASSAVSDARSGAPEKPDFWDDLGDLLGGIIDTAGDIGAGAINTLASLVSAAANNPLDTLETLGGAALTTISAAGEGLGVALDSTGVLAPVGGALNVASAAGLATGGGMVVHGVTKMAANANGKDQVSPVGGGGAPPSGPRRPPKKLDKRTIEDMLRMQRKLEARLDGKAPPFDRDAETRKLLKKIGGRPRGR